MTNATTGYTEVIKATQDAIKADTSTTSKWVNCGKANAEFFGTASALEGVKAQFIADAILPALPTKHAKALNTELPRKGSKEYNELSDTEKAQWEDVNQAKKDARSTCGTYFSRVLSYAFPKVKDDSNEPKASDETKDLEMLNALIKRLEKAESRPYLITDVLFHLHNARTTMSKPV